MKTRIQKIFAVGLIVGLAAAVSRLGAEIVTITLPPETAVYKDAPGVTLVNAQCLTCHSEEYVQMQPPLSLKAWTAEVVKMQQKYGAPIPTNVIPDIAYYLAVNYGTGAPARPPTPAPVQATTTNQMDVVKMATMYGCLACHQPDKKVIGPAYKDVRAKYLHDPDAITKIMAQIQHGGTGKWGAAVMPPFTAIGDADARRLAEWIMADDSSSSK
ncbi:MAG TPA: c-type cytochrome [Candidatus Sulfotelmatobacter sp.]|nr:c-type cytochrome [Candidatus Sulfotelmatobacter sp.]